MARRSSRQRDPGEVARVLVLLADLRRRARGRGPTAWSARARCMIAATVVPHDPAPITATDVWDPTIGSIRGPMFPDASRARASGAVIPIRAFALGKARLAASLDRAERAALGRRLAEQVVHAAAPLPVVVVSSDPDVRDLGERPRRSTCSTTRARSTAPPPPVATTSRDRGCTPRRRRPRRSPARTRSRPARTRRRAADRRPGALSPRRRHARALGPDRSRLPVRLRTRLVPPPRRGGTPARARAARRARPPTSRSTSTSPTTWSALDAATRRAAPRRDPHRHRAPRACPRDRRPSRRHRVRVRRDAREVGARRLRTSSCWCSPTARRALGTRRGPRRARGHPPARSSGRPPATLGAREVHFLDAVDGELEADAARREQVCARDPRRAARRGPRPRSVEAVPPAPRPPPRGPARDRRDRRRPRPALLPRRGHTAPPVARSCSSRPRTSTTSKRSTTLDVDAKIEALLCHRSQWRSTMGIEERIGPDVRRRNGRRVRRPTSADEIATHRRRGVQADLTEPVTRRRGPGGPLRNDAGGAD